MRNQEFFREIEHLEVQWRGMQFCIPIFYYDAMSINLIMLAPIEKVKAALPSKRMYPFNVLSGQCVVGISVLKYQDSDIGPYNEFAIGIPFTLDKPTPMFTGILWKLPEVPLMYIHHLPVTTQIALDAGVDLAGFPKILADIQFDAKDDRVQCHISADNKHILSISGRKLNLKATPRNRTHLITCRQGYLLRLELINSDREEGASKNPSDVHLEFGDHPIGQELRDWNLGRVMLYRYCPQYQMILTPVFESLAV